MYFSKLLLKDFGKFHNRDINLKPGVNVVYAREMRARVRSRILNMQRCTVSVHFQRRRTMIWRIISRWMDTAFLERHM